MAAEDACAPFTCAQHVALQATASTTASISALASGTIVTLYAYERFVGPIRWVGARWSSDGLAHRLVAFLAFSDFFASIFFAIGRAGARDPGLCGVQGFGIQFFALATVLWTCMIAVNLFATVMMRSPIGGSARKWDGLQRHEWGYHAVVWGLALFLACLVYAVGGYGDADIWCWVADPVSRIGVFFVIVICAWLLCATLHARILYEVVQQLRATHEAQSRTQPILTRVSTRLAMFVMVFIGTWLVGLINRLINLTAGAAFAPALLHVLVVPLQGFFNGCVYGGLLDRVPVAISQCLTGTDELFAAGEPTEPPPQASATSAPRGGADGRDPAPEHGPAGASAGGRARAVGSAGDPAGGAPAGHETIELEVADDHAAGGRAAAGAEAVADRPSRQHPASSSANNAAYTGAKPLSP